jgi:RimJ/RimL family protein N-acetyltransferase
VSEHGSPEAPGSAPNVTPALLGATPALATSRLSLTPLVPDDSVELARAQTDPALFTHIGGEPPSAEELEARIHRYKEGPRRAGEAWHNWAIREQATGALIGHLQATIREHGGSAELAWLVGSPWQGRGYATEAATALIDWLISAGGAAVATPMRELIAHIHPDNGASAKVAARLGLEPSEVVQDGEIRWLQRVEVARARR